MLSNFVSDVGYWSAVFGAWLDFMLGPSGVLRGPIVAFVGISIAGMAIYYVVTSMGILFTPSRRNRVRFVGAGTVWGTDREVDDLLSMGYERVDGKPQTSTYVLRDDDGTELSMIKVTRWQPD